MPELDIHPALGWAHPLVQEWFTAKFGTPTEPQIEGWPSILGGGPTLISAPTGSGKTLAAFLVCIDTLLRAALEGGLESRTHVVYVSPLKALSNDIQKNLDGPLAEIQLLAQARGYLCPHIRTGVRTGDTLAKERTAMLKTPPHILVTTPESLYILLTAGKPRENLTRVKTVIVDEIHAIADDKRGAHLALSLERLDALVCGENRLSPGARLTGLLNAPQRIGLSATQNPIELVANFLVGVNAQIAAGKVATPTKDVPQRLKPQSKCGIYGTGKPVPLSGPSLLSGSSFSAACLAAEGTRQPATIIQVGQRRTLDIAIEVLSDELGSITSIAMWTEVFDKLAALAGQHRSTLVFVNTRKLVEKISFELTNRLGPDAVAAHHGSLSRTLRLDAEQRLKSGEIKILVATASLELGIDIGTVDLVCQIATTRAVAVAMQRVGRAGHWRGAIPKGRFFATTRDDLLEQAALLRKMTAGELDRLEVPEQPMDVLMQQIVACCGAEPWEETALYNVLRRAWPYRNLTREHFDELIELLHEGIENSRGRYGAYLLRDRVQGVLHPRRGARMIAISNGGAIPDTALFAVMLQPENVQIATLDEHFAVDSSPGDVVLLGNTSWRIQRIESQGRVLVEDAHGAPPSIPFWEGEAPQRTGVLCDGVSDLRVEIDARTRNVSPSDLRNGFSGIRTDLGTPGLDSLTWDSDAPDPHQEILSTIAFLKRECFVNGSAALQLITYIVSGRAVLGAVPTKQTIIAERFFDEGGGQQLILHAPFGGRINKAWGLALRKRFCRGFNFELQAAATDNGINISLAEQHSFPLADVFKFVTEHTAKELLEQAAIPSPLFKNRWRWAAGRSLQLLRMSKGKRVAPQIQRTRSADLLASVFPHASACPETMTGDIEIPDHPLVREVMKDTLGEAMDIEGLLEVLRGIDSGAIQCIAVDTPVPSQFAHELINAMPYAFLDDEDAAARRARAVSLRRALPDSVADGAGRLDQAAIDTVRAQLWPDIRDEHELHDLLLSLVALPLAYVEIVATGKIRSTQHWPLFFSRLAAHGRAHEVLIDDAPVWIATERLTEAALLWPESAQSSGGPSSATVLSSPKVGPQDATQRLVQGWLQILGPTTSSRFAALTHIEPSAIHQAMLAMEMQGLAMRGVFERAKPADDTAHEIEWCERRILQRIHRLTLGTLRKQVEPVSAAVFMRWLLDWHHIAPQTQLTGEEGVLAAIEQLEAFEAPAVEWERTLLPARVANYDPRWLDNLCLAGIIGWGRISPHPAWTSSQVPSSSTEKVVDSVKGVPQRLKPQSDDSIYGTGKPVPSSKTELSAASLAPEVKAGPRRVIPTSAAPITFFLRESAEWLHYALAAKSVEEATLTRSLSPKAQQIRALLTDRGAAFTADLQRLSGLTKLQTATALWELATAGLASADGFDQLRAMMDPRRKSVALAQTAVTSLRKRAAARTTAGRWSLLSDPNVTPGGPSSRTVLSSSKLDLQTAAIAFAKRADAALDAQARILLGRYGVLFRDLLARESNAPKWRELAPILRRLEARGEIRGGRFVSGPFGEQFALPEAVESLRQTRREAPARSAEAPISVAAADALNLVGILVPGERVPALPGREVQFRNGVVVENTFPVTTNMDSGSNVSTPKLRCRRSIADILRTEAVPVRTPPTASLELFS